MTARTTIDKVKAIVEVPTNLTDDMITAFIADSSVLVDEELASTGQTDARLELIERYLTAHFITVLTERGGLTSQEVDNVKDTYGGPNNKSGFAMTRFGQQAIGFDSSGKLKAMALVPESKKLQAQFRVMG